MLSQAQIGTLQATDTDPGVRLRVRRILNVCQGSNPEPVRVRVRVRKLQLIDLWFGLGLGLGI